MLEKIIFIEDLAKRYNKKLHIGGSICYKHSSSMLRIGKILYENSISLIGNIVNVKYVKCNEGVGYDSYYVADKDVIIGVCDVGYVNGLNRFYNSLVFINDKFYKVVGKVCMDQCFILIDEHVKIGHRCLI